MNIVYLYESMYVSSNTRARTDTINYICINCVCVCKLYFFEHKKRKREKCLSNKKVLRI